MPTVIAMIVSLNFKTIEHAKARVVVAIFYYYIYVYIIYILYIIYASISSHRILYIASCMYISSYYVTMTIVNDKIILTLFLIFKDSQLFECF